MTAWSTNLLLWLHLIDSPLKMMHTLFVMSMVTLPAVHDPAAVRQLVKMDVRPAGGPRRTWVHAVRTFAW